MPTKSREHPLLYSASDALTLRCASWHWVERVTGPSWRPRGSSAPLGSSGRCLFFMSMAVAAVSLIYASTLRRRRVWLCVSAGAESLVSRSSYWSAGYGEDVNLQHWFTHWGTWTSKCTFDTFECQQLPQITFWADQSQHLRSTSTRLAVRFFRRCTSGYGGGVYVVT